VLLVLNAGSSSLKFSVFADERPPRPLVRGQLEDLTGRPRFAARAGIIIDEKRWDTPLDHQRAVDWLLDWLKKAVPNHDGLHGAGHRVVHGGPRLLQPMRVDAALLEELRGLVSLAPLHQPHNLRAIEAVAKAAPALPQVACFDTAFHGTQPPLAQTFGLPRVYFERGVRRYGFHGLSYEYVAAQLERQAPEAAAGRTVVAHLGNGASLCALLKGRSIATTMGFTALDGLVMGTRCGAIDPGVLLYLLSHDHLSTADLERLLYERSGLKGVSGGCSDMRELLGRADEAAGEAVSLFVYRARLELGSMAAALGGLDALVFTGGIGENAAPVRARICRDAAWLGVELDDEANARGGPRISTARSRASAFVIPTNEELMIATHTQRLLGGACP
jgi:acetate kinase